MKMAYTLNARKRARDLGVAYAKERTKLKVVRDDRLANIYRGFRYSTEGPAPYGEPIGPELPTTEEQQAGQLRITAPFEEAQDWESYPERMYPSGETPSHLRPIFETPTPEVGVTHSAPLSFPPRPSLTTPSPFSLKSHSALYSEKKEEPQEGAGLPTPTASPMFSPIDTHAMESFELPESSPVLGEEKQESPETTPPPKKKKGKGKIPSTTATPEGSPEKSPEVSEGSPEKSPEVSEKALTAPVGLEEPKSTKELLKASENVLKTKGIQKTAQKKIEQLEKLLDSPYSEANAKKIVSIRYYFSTKNMGDIVDSITLSYDKYKTKGGKKAYKSLHSASKSEVITRPKK